MSLFVFKKFKCNPICKRGTISGKDKAYEWEKFV